MYFEEHLLTASSVIWRLLNTWGRPRNLLKYSVGIQKNKSRKNNYGKMFWNVKVIWWSFMILRFPYGLKFSGLIICDENSFFKKLIFFKRKIDSVWISLVHNNVLVARKAPALRQDEAFSPAPKNIESITELPI